jgi:hypothetical protein
LPGEMGGGGAGPPKPPGPTIGGGATGAGAFAMGGCCG